VVNSGSHASPGAGDGELDLLGWYDQELDEIVISRLLDEHQVPGYAIGYVLYHEMLHLRHPMQIVNGRCHYHTPAFRQDEMKFDRYEDALKALLQLR
jgi:predicted metal-dependent hydrolase